MGDKNKKIGIIALIFALLALSQASAISSVTMNLIAGAGINITQSGDNYTISATGVGASDDTKVNKSGDSMTGNLYLGHNSVLAVGSVSTDVVDTYNIYTETISNYYGTDIIISNNINLSQHNITNCGNCLTNETMAHDNTKVNKTGDNITGYININYGGSNEDLSMYYAPLKTINYNTAPNIRNEGMFVWNELNSSSNSTSFGNRAIEGNAIISYSNQYNYNENTALIFQSLFRGNGTLSNSYGLRIFAGGQGGSGTTNKSYGNITNSFGGTFQSGGYNGFRGNITNNYGLYVLDASKTEALATITNNYGLYIASQTKGTNNFGIYQAGTNTNYLAGNISFATAGKGLSFKEGTNAKQGTCTLVVGICTVSNTAILSDSRLFYNYQNCSTNIGVLYESSRTPGTSFTLTSTNIGNTCVIAYEIFDVS